MLTRRKLAIPHVLGLDAGHAWWLTGGMSQCYPHTAPVGEPGAGGAAGGGGAAPESVGGESGAGGAGGETVVTPPDPNDAERMKEHLSAADRKRAAAERERDALAAKLKEIEDKDKDELTKTTERVQQLEAQVQKQDSELAELRLENAFLSVNEVEWHDAADALRAARHEGYLEGVVKDDGKVDENKLKAKLKTLAEKKAYLVKTPVKPGPQTPSGAPLGSNGQSSQPNNGDPDEKALKERYRTLRR